MGLHIDLNKIKQGFEHLPDQFKHLPDELQHAGIDITKVQQWIHHECVSVLETAAEEFAKRALRESAEAATKLYNELTKLRNSKPELVDAIDDVQITLSLSAVTLTYDKFYSRAEGLCKFLNGLIDTFEFKRSHIKNVITNTGPSSIAFNIDAEVFSSLLSIGAGIQIPIALGVELLDIVLAEIGVPE